VSGTGLRVTSPRVQMYKGPEPAAPGASVGIGGGPGSARHPDQTAPMATWPAWPAESPVPTCHELRGGQCRGDGPGEGDPGDSAHGQPLVYLSGAKQIEARAGARPWDESRSPLPDVLPGMRATEIRGGFVSVSSDDLAEVLRAQVSQTGASAGLRRYRPGTHTHSSPAVRSSSQSEHLLFGGVTPSTAADLAQLPLFLVMGGVDRYRLSAGDDPSSGYFFRLRTPPSREAG
jgi:hypothetical protein